MGHTIEWCGYTLTEGPEGTYACDVAIEANNVSISVSKLNESQWEARFWINGTSNWAVTSIDQVNALNLALKRQIESAEAYVALAHAIGDGHPKQLLRKCLDCRHLSATLEGASKTNGACLAPAPRWAYLPSDHYQRKVSVATPKSCQAFEAKT